jgi:hypothetical protein
VIGALPLRGDAPAAALRAGMLAVLLSASPAWAVLGGGVADVQGEQLRMRATRAVATTLQPGSVHELRLADGSSVRQYINAQGIVYAVAWSTRLKPDFTQLLGRYAADFDAGAAAVLRTPGIKRSIVVDQGDLVLQSGGRQGAFVGKAWLKSQMPVGTSANAIR